MSYIGIRKLYFIFLNVNEHLAVPFVELTKDRSHVDHPLLFTLDYLSKDFNLIYCSKSTVTCILFSVCVVDPNQTCLSSISPLGLFRGSYVTLRDRPLFISCVVWKWCSGFRYLTDTGVSRNIVPEKRQHIFTIFNLEDKCSWKSFEWWDNGMEREEGRKWNLYT